MGYGNRRGTNRRRSPKRRAGDRYTDGSYRRAIHRACDQAFPPPDHLARQRVKGKHGQRWETPVEWEQRLGPEGWAEVEQWHQDHRWSPHRLRHNAATRLRKQFGLEIARVVLGVRSAEVAEIYAEMDDAKAREVMGKVG